MPRILNIELQDSMVNTCMPGDEITVTGILKVFVQFLFLNNDFLTQLFRSFIMFQMQKDDNFKSKVNKETISSPCALYIQAISIRSNKNKTKSIEFDFNYKDFQDIQASL